ncbi:hypothetical protein CHT97_11300 [Lacticaseibacillus chiayiensis]|nr:hypothetical protein CHT97_11300 [Lacticaseibacillus chiayiensis]
MTMVGGRSKSTNRIVNIIVIILMAFSGSWLNLQTSLVPQTVQADENETDVFKDGPAYDVPTATKVNYKAVVKHNWNLLDKPFTEPGYQTIGYYSSVIGANYIGTKVTISERVKDFSTYADLITLPSGKSYWVDDHSLTITSDIYQNGPALNLPNAKIVSYKAKVVADWNLCSQPWDTLTYFSNVNGKNYVGQTVTVTREIDRGNGVIAVLVTLPDNSSYWVDKNSLAVTYQVLSKEKYQVDGSDPSYWQDFRSDGGRIYTIKPTVTDYPIYEDTFGNGHILGYSSNLVGTYYLANEVETILNASGTKTTAVHISNDNINWYWVDKDALSFGQDGYKTAYEGSLEMVQMGQLSTGLRPMIL